MRFLVFLLRSLELLDIAIELSDILAHEGIAFALLLFGRGLPQETFNGLHSGQSVYLDAHNMVLRAPDAR